MPYHTVPAPDEIPDSDDPGDDIARRFRYQWAYAAIVCCMLLDETRDVDEIFCEHHEDVLIKHNDATFTGLQVKTRQSDQNLWNTNDKGVKDSCARFAKLESQFPGKFRAFRFLTNHPLYGEKNGKNLCYVLDVIKRAASARDLSGSFATFLNRVAQKAHCTADKAFIALSKTDAMDDLPKIHDVEVRLIDALIPVWARGADCPYYLIQRAARYLISECERASSLAYRDVLPAYLSASSDPEGFELSARLDGKRINRSRVLSILDRGLNQTAPLFSAPETCVEPGTGFKDLLLKKLDAGGFSVVSLNSALDLRDKSDYLGISWKYKYGNEEGLQRYNHIRSLVLRDSGIAFEAKKHKVPPFGPDMLSDLRLRFEQRQKDGSQLYGCSIEHLEGFAFTLTSQCKVQWSLDRPWEA